MSTRTSTVRVAGAPVSFGVFELTPEDSPVALPDGAAVLAALVETGYDGVDLGPRGFLDGDGELRARLQSAGLDLAGGWIELPLSDDARYSAAVADLEAALDVFSDAGSGAIPPRPTLADTGDAVRRAHPGGAAGHGLDAAGWERVGRNLGPALVAAQAIAEALGAGGKLLAFGNGGSAADAQHLAAELVGRFQKERAAIPAIALTVDTSVLTSVANDYSFKQVFARQVQALGRPGDVAIGISTSGESPNVVHALNAAKAKGLKTIALTGRDGGSVGRAADLHVNVPDQSTARVQEVHRTLIHVMCEVIEEGANA